jgi:hypothetical protein
MKTVFFGPFIGEFGWEYLYWHAWVNKVCQNEYKDYKKIVASYPGRESFYPLCDEYWAHPIEFIELLNSCNGYITDYWSRGFPRWNASVQKKFLGLIPYESWEFSKPEQSPIEIKGIASELLDSYIAKLPKDSIIYAPFKLNTFDGLEFGIIGDEMPSSDKDIIQKPIPFSRQQFEILQPSLMAKNLITNYLQPDIKLIAIFPRNRINRRPDKNWNKDKYLQVIKFFTENYNEYKIGIFGSPGQAFFDHDLPVGAIDFINLPDNQRMNIQIAALKQSYLALGSLSGATLIARSAGVPTISWGLQRDGSRFHSENLSNIETIFHPVQNPDSDQIIKLSVGILEKSIMYDAGFENWSSQDYLAGGSGNNYSKWRVIFEKIKSFFFASNKNIIKSLSK